MSETAVGYGSRNRFLVKGSGPRWSPDGTRILMSWHQRWQLGRRQAASAP